MTIVTPMVSRTDIGSVSADQPQGVRLDGAMVMRTEVSRNMVVAIETRPVIDPPMLLQ